MNEEFLIGSGIGDLELEHEAVDLGLGERIGPLLLDRVLGGQHQERHRELKGLIAYSDLAFLHGLEQRRLHLGGGAVDFIGQDEVGEDGAFADREFAILGGIDEGADQIAGEQVGGELDALEAGLDGIREGLDREGFGQAGHPLDKDMAIGEEADKQSIDEVALADNDLSDFAGQASDKGRFLLDELLNFRYLLFH